MDMAKSRGLGQTRWRWRWSCCCRVGKNRQTGLLCRGRAETHLWSAPADDEQDCLHQLAAAVVEVAVAVADLATEVAVTVADLATEVACETVSLVERRVEAAVELGCWRWPG